MITLDYLLAQDEVRTLDATDLTHATAAELDYYLFRGDIYFRIDDQVFDASWGWVPIIEFATQLHILGRRLVEKGSETVEFTESEATINLRLADGKVVVSSSYSLGTAEVDYFEFTKETERFLRSVLTDFARSYPSLLQNPNFVSRGKTVGLFSDEM